MNGINIKKPIVQGIMIGWYIIFSQTSFSQILKNKEQGYFNSHVYQSVLQGSKPEEKKHEDFRFFMRIHEEAFLSDNSYDHYAVFLYAPREADSFSVFVVKSKKGITTASYKRFKTKYFYYYSPKEENDFDLKDVKFQTRFVQSELSNSLKLNLSKIVKADHSKRKIPAYDGPLQAFFYFDGEKYFFCSDLLIGSESMEEIRSLMQKILRG